VSVADHEVGPLDEGSLAAYLRNHIAGSESAEGLAQRLLKGDEHDEDVKRFLEGFIDEIREERGYVESIMEGLDRDRSLIRRGLDAATELAGMAGELVATVSPGPFADLEALAVGVWGKRLLWGTLLKLAEVDERFQRLPLADLSDQAERQEVELLRLRDDSIVPSLSAEVPS
jgi:hypothetical protein